jgi:hypothetical protein
VVAPVTVMVLIVAVAFPVLVSVTCFDVLLPTAIAPKLRLVEEALIAAAVPVPFAVIVIGELVALLAIEIVAESAAADCGVNVTVSVALAPGAMDAPLAMPLAE